MKVLIIAYDTNVRSGWGRHAAMVAEAYDALGIEYQIISEEGPGEPNPCEKKVLLRSTSLASIMRNLLRIFFVVRRGYTYDVAHAFDVWPYGLYAYAAVLGTRSKLFLNGIGTYSVAPFYSPFKRFMLGFVIGRTSKIFCISNYTKNQMHMAMPCLDGKLALGWLGATELPVPLPAEVERIQTRYGIRGRGPFVLTVGAIKDRKGQLDTLKAVAALKNAYHDILYITVGSSDDAEYVKSLHAYARDHNLEENLKIIDSVQDDRDLAAFYMIADVFALNSRNDAVAHHFEGFGLVFLEAYQFGKAGVGSRDCGIEDAVENGETGYLTAQGNSQDIAEKIGMVLECGSQTFASAAREFRAKFNWDTLAALYVLEYRAKKYE